jgi:ATP-dependent DNA helicase RecQ
MCSIGNLNWYQLKCSRSETMHHPSTQNQQIATDPIQSALQQFFGYTDFRPPQRAIVEALIQQQDALIVLPTGGGKSLCFQLPALMQPGLTLVISPLVALMENQVQELRQRRLPARVLHSQLSKQDYHQTLSLLTKQQLRLLYLSPETLFNSRVWPILNQPSSQVRSLVIDEAHCLAQWGETFRPAYFRLGAARRSLQAQMPNQRLSVAAFTATADPTAQQTIQRILQLDQPQQFRLNPYQNNLHLTVQRVWTPHQRRHQLWSFIVQQKSQSGLVYVRTRRDSETLALWLTQQGLQTAAYHAGLSPDARRRIEQAWLTDQLQFVVSTNAFGMGINKSNVRWITHFQAPMLLSEYVQEVGRAGRDGHPAIALMLVSEPTGWLDPEDQQRWQFFQQQTYKQYRSAQTVIRKLPLTGEVTAVTQQFPAGAIALSLLHHLGLLEWQDPFHYVIQSRSQSNSLGQSNARAVQTMKRYLLSKICRWQFILKAFGFEDEATHFRCGHCDNCLR